MTWEPRPVPNLNPDTERFWAEATDETFVLNKCADCGFVFYYPRPVCPDCDSMAIDWMDASGEGVVYSYSVQESVAGWPSEHLPLVVAYVELAEGPRIISNLIECDPTDVSIGLPVTVRFIPTNRDDVAVPVFAPA